MSKIKYRLIMWGILLVSYCFLYGYGIIHLFVFCLFFLAALFDILRVLYIKKQ